MLIKNKKFDHVMSREAKELRDGILDICIQNGMLGLTEEQGKVFIEAIVMNYDPIQFEIAVLYAAPGTILEAVNRSTSTKYHEKEKPGINKPLWERGNPKGHKHKSVNWVEVSTLHQKWWIDCIQFPRTGFMRPNDINKIRQQFIQIYMLFVNWLIVDFSLRSLRMVLQLALKHSPEFINRCMDLVTDRSKKTIDYLLVIIDHEYAIELAEIRERSELNERSKNMLMAFLEEINRKDDAAIDIDEIEKKMKTNIENADAFNEVKLT